MDRAGPFLPDATMFIAARCSCSSFLSILPVRNEREHRRPVTRALYDRPVSAYVCAHGYDLNARLCMESITQVVVSMCIRVSRTYASILCKFHAPRDRSKQDSCVRKQITALIRRGKKRLRNRTRSFPLLIPFPRISEERICFPASICSSTPLKQCLLPALELSP